MCWFVGVGTSWLDVPLVVVEAWVCLPEIFNVDGPGGGRGRGRGGGGLRDIRIQEWGVRGASGMHQSCRSAVVTYLASSIVDPWLLSAFCVLCATCANCRFPLLTLMFPALLLLPKTIATWATDELTVRAGDNSIVAYKQRVHNIPTAPAPVRWLLGCASSWLMMYLLGW